MESDNLYRVQEEDLPRLQKLLTVCFAQDPLYHTLIPDDATRERLLPELFSCDLTEFFQTCEIYSDSSELNSILVVSDESEPYNVLQYCLTEARAAITTDGWLIKEDPSLKTFWNFIQGKDYLNSSWTDQLHQTERLHVIYLAVDPGHQHHGLAEVLMDERNFSRFFIKILVTNKRWISHNCIIITFSRNLISIKCKEILTFYIRTIFHCLSRFIKT